LTAAQAAYAAGQEALKAGDFAAYGVAQKELAAALAMAEALAKTLAGVPATSPSPTASPTDASTPSPSATQQTT